jgi:Core-2/I-Branching enzyme
MSDPSPKIAFLIAAHEEPFLVRRLVLSLAAPWARFFVHIDRHVPAQPFAEALSGIAHVTFIQPRVSVNWGGWSQIEATLLLMRRALAQDATLARFALLSGACYPLRSNEALRDFLFASEAEYINASPMPDIARDKPLTRLTRWQFEGGLRGQGLRAKTIRLLNDSLRILPARDLKVGLDGLAPYHGSTWWVLTRLGVETVLDWTDRRPKLAAFLRHTHCPDECFFQTVLANSALKERLAPSLTFTDWSDPQEQPRRICDGHLSQLLGRDGAPFFARKFSSGNAHLLDRIDAVRGIATASPGRRPQEPEPLMGLSPGYAATP